ncbi:MAG: N-acetyl-gamma-glutamyl-phosphate reductase [Clostridiales bacterium]|nr:N-acetyl-gamma-glutamyl-phosphate reductase [Clostridiales bacterium]
MKKIFIDGKDGTTGLKIYERFKDRKDIELMLIDPQKRKDPEERGKMINSSDIAFLCLPDAAAREAVGLVTNDNVKIIDASTAHRTESGWAYGFPELSKNHRKAIENSNRIAVPGCYAGGFISIVYPLIQNNFISRDYNIVSHALSGYTGAGNKGIAQYEDDNREAELDSPRLYALTQEHRHLKEMQIISGLAKKPCFSPIICDYPRGMAVAIQLYTDVMNEKYTLADIYEMYAKHYADTDIVKVRKPGYTQGFLGSNNFAGRDDMEIEINGNDERVIITSRFDNLGKGASGAAIQCMNIAMGIDEKTGLNIGD